MRDILPDVELWRTRGESIAVATVVETWGSAPRGVGAKMAFTASGHLAGSVSGGCVEGAVIEAGRQVLRTGQPQLLHFGVADETAWDVGLACGGNIDVFVQSLDDSIFTATRRTIDSEHVAAHAMVIRGPATVLGREVIVQEDGSSVGAAGDDASDQLAGVARAALAEGQPRRVSLPYAGESIEVFVDVLLPAPTLIIVGGVHIAIALAALAKTLGYRTVVIDPRRAFGSQERFPNVDQLMQTWPDEALARIGITRSTAVVMLTHDPKIDDPALLAALPGPAFYVGALGSRKTQASRRERMLKAGLSQAHLDRLHGPVGLDIGAKTPAEIALAIMAQIVATRHAPGE